MLMFNEEKSHAVLAHIASGHVLFMNAETPAPIACTTPSGAACQDPALRPDNAPISPIVDSTSRLYVSYRCAAEALFVIDSRANPMRIIAEYDTTTVNPNGCGGVQSKGKMYVNAGGGTQANPHESDLYAFTLWQLSPHMQNPPNTPASSVVFTQDDRGFVDSHGAATTRPGRYLWVADRAANKVGVVDTRHDRVAGEIELTGAVSSSQFVVSGQRSSVGSVLSAVRVSTQQSLIAGG